MTFYELLNVSRDSSSEEIELAFSVRLAEFSREAATGSEGAAKKISDPEIRQKNTHGSQTASGIRQSADGGRKSECFPGKSPEIAESFPYKTGNPRRGIP